jgi:hypothetical protein
MRLQKLTKAWFDLPNDPDGAKFEIKHLLAGEIAEIIEKTHNQRFEFRKNEDGDLKPVPIIENNKTLERELTVVAVITDWENHFDENGKILDCTDENKLRTCKELSEEDFKIFLDFITDCRQKLSETVKNQAEAERKN